MTPLERSHPRVHPADHPWLVKFICCGHDDGMSRRATWAEADELRESYLDVDSHIRSAIISRADPQVRQGAVA